LLSILFLTLSFRSGEAAEEPAFRREPPMRYYVYIMSSKSRVLYVGVTGSLMSRVLRHKAGQGSAFTRHYRVHRLVYYASFQNIGDAIARETEIKNWRREKKVALIRENNPTWEDLAEDWGKPIILQVARKAGSSAANAASE
jgi:putative endonuclease